jgi:hypothetical protein
MRRRTYHIVRVSGKYANSTASLSCDNCEAGKYAATSSQLSCSVCPQGRISDAGKSICDSCESGTSENVLTGDSKFSMFIFAVFMFQESISASKALHRATAVRRDNSPHWPIKQSVICVLMVATNQRPDNLFASGATLVKTQFTLLTWFYFLWFYRRSILYLDDIGIHLPYNTTSNMKR